ncbi:Poly [ADP-ribose] polymerase 6 [Nibea albiflora]|uniref:Poly [ADP-ribose] polymerase 6 n=1 Tax=Nibea albiflora TaxID=240163 RepID=A0ACB7FI35_NIBAL|nr:Poly [ADP-ribose] polymerase 6 [Nibea albiflora]
MESLTDEDSDTEEILYQIHESCATDLYHHPQLETDIEAVRTLYSDSAVSIREYGSIDDVAVDLNINANVLDKEVAMVWRINPSEPIVIRLHFSLSQYLDGPAPSVEVFQTSNTDHFGVGKQLQSRSKELQEPTMKERIFLPVKKLNRFTNHTTSYSIKNPTGELFTYTPSGKRVVVSAVKSPAQLSTKQLIELLFSSQAIGHCKTTPTLQHGFFVQIMRYAEQRIPTLNEYCVVCDERHVFQNGRVLKPAVCTRELCVFSFSTLGVMSGVTEEVATGAEVVDLLVAMCRAALQSSRKSIIFEPYPSVIDPCNPKTLAFNPKRKSYDRLQKALDSVLLVRRMAQGPYSEIKKQLDKIDPLAHPLLQCGSHIENWHSILRNGLINASYTKLQLHGAAYGKGIYLSPISSISFGYSEMGNGRHQIPTKEELIKKYNQINKIKQEQPGQARFLQNRNLNCIALCEGMRMAKWETCTSTLRKQRSTGKFVKLLLQVQVKALLKL